MMDLDAIEKDAESGVSAYYYGIIRALIALVRKQETDNLAAPGDRAAPAAVAGWQQLPPCQCFTEQQEQYCMRQRKCSKAVAYSADATPDRRDPDRLAVPSGIADRRKEPTP